MRAMAIEGVGLVGFISLLEGLRRYSVPLAFIVAGVLLMAWAVAKQSFPRPE